MTRETLILTAADVDATMNMRECIGAVESAFGRWGRGEPRLCEMALTTLRPRRTATSRETQSNTASRPFKGRWCCAMPTRALRHVRHLP